MNESEWIEQKANEENNAQVSVRSIDPSNRELDALLAEHLFHLPNVQRDWPAGRYQDGDWCVADNQDGTNNRSDGTTYSVASITRYNHPVYSQLRIDGTEAYKKIVPFYSTYLIDALLVVEKLKEYDYYFSCSNHTDDPDQAWWVRFARTVGEFGTEVVRSSLSRAICDAAGNLVKVPSLLEPVKF